MRCESFFDAVCVVDHDLLIAAICSKCEIYQCIAQGVDAIIHSWNWVEIAYSDGIHLPMIEPKA